MMTILLTALWKCKQIILLQNWVGRGEMGKYMSLHLLILVCKTFSYLLRSEVLKEPDEKEMDGTHLIYTNSFLICILIAALTYVSEKVGRIEMRYALGGLSQLDLHHTIPIISTERYARL